MTGRSNSIARKAAATVAIGVLICLGGGARAESELFAPGGWALTLYGGIGTDGGIEDFPGLKADFNNAYMTTVAVSREVARWRGRAALEIEGQIAKHFVKQNHVEGNLLFAVRWLDFPWNDVVRTSFAVGEGISYASSVPEIERERSPGKTSRLLNYIMIELELAPPDQDEWSFVTRIHHRSGVYGLYNGVSKGSNLLGFGIKRRF
ncbi:MAG: hypothetical protein WD407_14935 [Rhodospirillales bacterium]